MYFFFSHHLSFESFKKNSIRGHTHVEDLSLPLWLQSWQVADKTYFYIFYWGISACLQAKLSARCTGPCDNLHNLINLYPHTTSYVVYLLSHISREFVWVRSVSEDFPLEYVIECVRMHVFCMCMKYISKWVWTYRAPAGMCSLVFWGCVGAHLSALASTCVNVCAGFKEKKSNLQHTDGRSCINKHKWGLHLFSG